MRSTTVARVACVSGLAFLIAGSSLALGAKPARAPYSSSPIVHGVDPGTYPVCAFTVETSQSAGSNYTFTDFGNGRIQITGSGQDRAKNMGTGASVTFPTSGKITQTSLASGDYRVKASGRTLFYFYEGDEGPFGVVGPNGALYYITGHVDETLASDFVVTSFRWSGQATEVCSLID